MNEYRDTAGLRFFSPDKLEEQRQREADMVTAGKLRYDKRLKTKQTIDTAPGLKLLEETFGTVKDQIGKAKAEQSARKGRKRGWFKLLRDVDDDILAWQALAGALNAAKVLQNHTTASQYVGGQLAAHLQLEAAAETEGQLVKQHEKWARRHNRDDVRKRKMANLADGLGHRAPEWTLEELIIIGEFLIGEVEGATSLIQLIKIKKPGASHITMKIGFSDTTGDAFETANKILGEMLPVSLPMLVPPRPWTNNHDGGLVEEHRNVKLLNEKMVSNPKGTASLDRDNCPVTFSAVTAMQDTAYHINESVRRVMQACLDTDDPMVPSKSNIPQVTTEMPKELNEKDDAGMLSLMTRRSGTRHTSMGVVGCTTDRHT
jgi:DNA-directed RNA polymerase